MKDDVRELTLVSRVSVFSSFCTSRHLFQRIAEHKHSALGKHLQQEHRLQLTNLQDQFTVLKKCRTKFDCLLYEMLFIRNIKPKLNTQSDSVRAKLFT